MVSKKPQDAILQAQLEVSEQSQSAPSRTFYVGYDVGLGLYLMAFDKSMLASCTGIMAWEIDDHALLQDILARLCSHQGGSEFIIHNPNEFKFQMDTSFVPLANANLT